MLTDLARKAPNYYREFTRETNGKRRLLVEAVGPLKAVQRRILDNVLLRPPPAKSSFGAIKGRSIKENARRHCNSKYIAKLDIQDFYPSIRSTKVYTFFVELECSPDIANLLTPLTTRNYSLPLGASTSPMLADQILSKVDVRINGMAEKVGLRYTRYVDDITLSGNFPLNRLVPLVMKVLSESGFKTKKKKLVLYGPDDDGKERIITGVRVAGGKVSAPLDYVVRLQNELKEAIHQSRKKIIAGEFHPSEHYRGQITYVRWLDPRLGNQLMRLYRKVKWRHLELAMSAQADEKSSSNGDNLH